MIAVLPLLLGVLCLVLAVALLVPALELEPSNKKKMKARIRELQARPEKGVTAVKKRQLSSTNAALGALRLVSTPSGIARLERHLSLAGRNPDRLPVVLLAKVAAPAIILVFGAIVVPSVGSPLAWLIYVVAIGVSYFAPDIIVHGRAVERQTKMTYDLPDILDQIVISIEAGMGFESALARVGANNHGPLGEEIVRTVQDMSLGMSRRDSYLALASRNDVEDLKRFTKSIVQAEEFGVPISRVVRIQADEMRDKRRQRARETAMKVPVKLLFPMLTCIMPVLFIVILTPAILSLGKVL
ncbi:hypothetical protein GCM10022234_07860 [Aeromicrobium panaciterrae]|uniref:type II secretion system F family protein n=1 Tax=Aeromicrobium panaciterrae TaxID=363861 RepID=UPI0031E4624D